MIATIGRLGAIPTRHDPGLEAASRRRAPVGPALPAARAVPAKGRQEAAGRPGGLPERRRRLPAPARRARGDARRRDAAPRRRALGSRRLRHARQPGSRPRGRPEADGRLAPRVPARPRGARARRSRARARLVGVRPARQGERLRRHRPRRRRHGLPDRLARRRDDDRRVPRARPARRGRQPSRDRRLPRALRRADRGLARRRRRPRSSPAPGSSAGRRSCDETPARGCGAPRARRRRRVGGGNAPRRRPARRCRPSEFRLTLSRPCHPSRPGDHRARQLRRGRPRPRAAQGRWHADLPDRARASGQDG